MTYIGKINNGESQSRISSINPRFIGKKDLIKIVEVEQDMWARDEGLGEYVKCGCCSRIYSKEDIFGHLERKLKVQTVADIERALGGRKPICLSCGEETTPIFDRNQYIEEIRDRYKNTIESFLTVYRDENGEIRGFFDGYIDNFENIYRREFEYYYSNFGIEGLKRLVKERFGVDLPEYLLMCSALGMEEGYKNFNLLYEMMREFFMGIYLKYGGNLMGIAESTIGSNTNAIYISVGAIGIGVNDYPEKISNKTKKSDVFIHQGITKDYNEKLSVTPRRFISNNIGIMKQIVNVA